MFRTLKMFRTQTLSIRLQVRRQTTAEKPVPTFKDKIEETQEFYRGVFPLLQLLGGAVVLTGTCVYYVVSRNASHEKNIEILQKNIEIAQVQAELTAIKGTLLYSNTEEYAQMRQARNKQEMEEIRASNANDKVSGATLLTFTFICIFHTS
jgi:hypothetical protein